ncbi:MAG: Asp-tRNA(Asn)/Glu-tRNA(Gln) amidotransferase subunit GatA [Candidatus Paceibacterota bacterium]
MDTKTLTITKCQKGYSEGEFTPSDVVAALSKNINEKNDSLNAYLEVFEDVNEQIDNLGEQKGDLWGIPLGIKDNILIKGKTASGGSRILEGYTAPYDATAIKKLKNKKVLFLGRTNMDEFAMGSSTENSAFGSTKNPIDESRVPGGSSGGSAAVVAAGMAIAALGSDTGGSIRQPASLCGLVGFKPTYGAISRSGLMAMGSSLDQIGPITKTVKDTQILFDAMSGNDPLDSTTLPDDSFKDERKDAYTIGVPRDLIEQEGIDDDVLEQFNSSLESLKEKGHTIKEIDLEHADYALAAYYIVMPAEVSSNLARYDGVKFGLHEEGENLLDEYFKTRGVGFGEEVRRRIILGTYVLSSGYYDAYYNKASALRSTIRSEFDVAFKEVDAIATPTTPTPAFKIGEKIDDPLAMYLEDIFTVPANIIGVPAISVPSGTAKRDGVVLPLGFQLIAPHTHESTLFALGEDIEDGV